MFLLKSLGAFGVSSGMKEFCRIVQYGCPGDGVGQNASHSAVIKTFRHLSFDAAATDTEGTLSDISAEKRERERESQRQKAK